jgi:hemerythrin superfamily protein
MDAIEPIRQDHRRIEELFEQFLQAEPDMTQEELFQEIQTGLSAHSEMEERVLYSELKSTAVDQVEKALQEHSEVKEIRHAYYAPVSLSFCVVISIIR